MRVRTLAVGYRLAPEHPFPAALEDALTAWRLVRGQGVPARSIAVGGDSAGGGLSVALTQRAEGEGEELPACAWLVSPWTDLTMSGATLATRDAVDPLIHKAYLRGAGRRLCAGRHRPAGPARLALHADLEGLPPTLIQVGSAETLLDDAVRFAAAAGSAACSTTLEIWPDMIHAWPLWNARLTQAAARSATPAPSCSATSARVDAVDASTERQAYPLTAYGYTHRFLSAVAQSGACQTHPPLKQRLAILARTMYA